jgi:uncharacterized repeat protein (TIGR03847 family)
MSRDLHNFGRVDLLDAEAIGQPGQRRFRLIARGGGETASLWLERQQLEQLSLALDQLLAQIAGGDLLRPEAMAERPATPGAPADFPEHPDLDFQVGQLTLGYDEAADHIVLLAARLELMERAGEVTARENVDPEFAGHMSRDQATRLSTHIAGVLAAGRPRCPFCGQPIDDQHVCVKQNGHRPMEIN